MQSAIFFQNMLEAAADLMLMLDVNAVLTDNSIMVNCKYYVMFETLAGTYTMSFAIRQCI